MGGRYQNKPLAFWFNTATECLKKYFYFFVVYYKRTSLLHHWYSVSSVLFGDCTLRKFFFISITLQCAFQNNKNVCYENVLCKTSLITETLFLWRWNELHQIQLNSNRKRIPKRNGQNSFILIKAFISNELYMYSY